MVPWVNGNHIQTGAATAFFVVKNNLGTAKAQIVFNFTLDLGDLEILSVRTHTNKSITYFIPERVYG